MTVAGIGHGICRASTPEIRRRAFLDELKAIAPIHPVTEALARASQLLTLCVMRKRKSARLRWKYEARGWMCPRAYWTSTWMTPARDPVNAALSHGGRWSAGSAG